MHDVVFVYVPESFSHLFEDVENELVFHEFVFFLVLVDELVEVSVVCVFHDHVISRVGLFSVDAVADVFVF